MLKRSELSTHEKIKCILLGEKSQSEKAINSITPIYNILEKPKIWRQKRGSVFHKCGLENELVGCIMFKSSETILHKTMDVGPNLQYVHHQKSSLV